MNTYYAHLKDMETGKEWFTTIHTREILFEGDEILVDGHVTRIINFKEA